MVEILSFDGYSRRCRIRVGALELTDNRKNRFCYANEWHSRLALIKQFRLGASVRTLGRKHPKGEEGMQADLRAALMGAPAYDMKKAA
jgi:hypothetical protein